MATKAKILRHDTHHGALDMPVENLRWGSMKKFKGFGAARQPKQFGKGGKVSACRGDGCAVRGKTKGRFR